jgi:hypothetical protein
MGGVEIHLRLFSTSVLEGREWPNSRCGRFSPGKIFPRYPLNMWMGGTQKLPYEL